MALMVSEACHAIVNGKEVLLDSVLYTVEGNNVVAEKTDSMQADTSTLFIMGKRAEEDKEYTTEISV